MIEIKVTYYPPTYSEEGPGFLTHVITPELLRAAKEPEELVKEIAVNIYRALRANCPDLVKEVPNEGALK